MGRTSDGKFPLASRPLVCDTGGVLGTAIREARLERRLTLADVATAVGTSKQNVSRIELGKPTTTTLLESVLAGVGLEMVTRKVKARG